MHDRVTAVMARMTCHRVRHLPVVDGGKLTRRAPADRHVLLHPGQFFGEMSLLDGGPRSATVAADPPIRLLVISYRHFATLLRDVPGLTQTILVTLSARVRQAEERAERFGPASTGL